MTCCNILLVPKVGDVVGNKQITDMWHHMFSGILNSVYNAVSKKIVCDHIDFVFPKSKIVIGFSAIIESLRETKLGKFARIDGLAAEHFLFTRTVAHLALLFTCMLKLLNHGHVPTAFMKTSFFSDLNNRIGDSIQ